MENQRSRTSIWLVNTLLAYRKLSLREINQLWLDDPDMSGGGPMTRIRLQRAISSAFDVMGVAIECDIHDRYRYYIAAKYDLKATEEVLKRELAAEEPSVIISRRPCALLKYVKHPGPIKVNADKCRGCKSCMRIGCPAISIKNGKACIDDTLCVGCGVCTQLCAFSAFEN